MSSFKLSFDRISAGISKVRERRRHRSDPATPDPTGSSQLTGGSYEPSDSLTGMNTDDGGYARTETPVSRPTSTANGSRDHMAIPQSLSSAHAGVSPSVDFSSPGNGPGNFRKQFEKSFLTCKTRGDRFELIFSYWSFTFPDASPLANTTRYALWKLHGETEAKISDKTESVDLGEYAQILADLFYKNTKPDRAWEPAPIEPKTTDDI